MLVAYDGDTYEIGRVRPPEGYESALRDLPAARFDLPTGNGVLRWLLDFYLDPESQPHATREISPARARALMAGPLEELVAQGRARMAAFYAELARAGERA